MNKTSNETVLVEMNQYLRQVAAPTMYPNQLAIAKAMVPLKMIKRARPAKENIKPKFLWKRGATARRKKVRTQFALWIGNVRGR